MDSPRLLKDEQLLSLSYRKKTMEKTQTCNAISTNLKEEHANVNALIELEGKAMAMATHEDEASPSGIRSGKTYLKAYSKVGLNKYMELSEKPARQKELRFQKNSKKDTKAMGTPFQFDVIA